MLINVLHGITLYKCYVVFKLQKIPNKTKNHTSSRTEQYISNGATSYKQLVLCMSQSYGVVEMIKFVLF